MDIQTIIYIVIFASIAFFIYFAPTFVAYRKKHRQREAILILNLFLGWTTIGWVIALVWAYIKEKQP